ncbi:TetR/AcrR family transcriptional regulator [Arthrobacter sp. Y-9]|uniref:TetR/AcrR family transcriptional regulator n=1 Tax=Arthrobacter sp. Y-9 TaxID=3039385 RepID=UPI002420009A|nr:TetR/AcrR family transcriptional regulator [Arthrobacter sp. Y-9]WFR82757.1 TetR/AcrR family transcriptional regulator C-terminal ligand-binding domain-containing protein [Arthrobacter sp. Y-9]
MATKRGRPLSSDVSEALRKAAERIMQSSGYSSLTVDGLVAEVGTTRPTFYRRYRNVGHLAFDVIQHRFGVNEIDDTGALSTDLLRLQRQEVAMFADPLLRNNLPGLLETIRIDESIRVLYLTQFIAPRRGNVQAVLNRAVVRGELEAEQIDLDWICDLLLSPLLTKALLPVGAGLTDELARRTAELAFDQLMATAAPAARV